MNWYKKAQSYLDIGHGDNYIRATPEILKVASHIRLADEDDVVYALLEAQRAVLYEFIKNPRGKQPWTVIPADRLKKIWKDYATYGIVRDVRGIDEIATHMINNIMRLNANTELAGHSQIDPKEIYDEVGIKYTEKRDEMFGNYILDENGQWRISDYGLPKLMDLAFKLGNANDSREKLLIIDQMLNVFHQRSNLPAMFVEGGGITLDELYESPEEKERIEKIRDEEKKPKPIKDKKQLELGLAKNKNWYRIAMMDRIIGMTDPTGKSISISEDKLEGEEGSPHQEFSMRFTEARKMYYNLDTVRWYFQLSNNLIKYWTRPSRFIRTQIDEHLKQQYNRRIRREEWVVI